MSGWPNADNWDEERKTLPVAQRTQGIASKLELSLQLEILAPLALVAKMATRWRHLH